MNEPPQGHHLRTPLSWGGWGWGAPFLIHGCFCGSWAWRCFCSGHLAMPPSDEHFSHRYDAFLKLKKNTWLPRRDNTSTPPDAFLRFQGGIDRAFSWRSQLDLCIPLFAGIPKHCRLCPCIIFFNTRLFNYIVGSQSQDQVYLLIVPPS